jgi:hypothetical protein
LPTSKRRLLGALPFAHECVWTIKYLMGAKVKPFNGRWRRLEAMLGQLDAARAGGHRPDRPRRLLVFGYGDFWIDYLLPLAVVLAGREGAVDFLWLPGRYEPQQQMAYLRRFYRWSARFAPPSRDGFRLINLREFEPQSLSAEEAERVDAGSRYDTCYFNAKETCDVEGCAEDRATYEFRRAQATEHLGRLKTFLAGHAYDSTLTANGKMCEFGLFHWYVRRQGLMCVTLDGFESDDAVVASQDGPCIEWRTDAAWAGAPRELTPEIRQRVQQRIEYRDNPAVQTNLWFPIQTSRSDSGAELLRQLNLDPARPVALMCTNLAWDSAVLGNARGFATMKEWYLAVIAWFAQRPQWQLVVRTHPVEAKLPQPMSVSDFIDREYPTLPANVRLVRSHEKLNTYGIMKVARLGLVFTSTVGLEMVIRGLPVITAGNVHYAAKGFTTDPPDRDAYFRALEQATTPPGLQLEPPQVELAQCYFDAYFERFPKKIPWSYSHLAEDMKRWPIDRVIAGDCPREYLDTFDYLAGRPVAG